MVYVRNPGSPAGAIHPDRLAAASGTPLAALHQTLTGLPKPRPDRDRQKPKPPTHDAQAARKAKLFKGIRYDASRGLSMRKIAERRRTHRRMIRQALASPDSPPPPRKRINRSAPMTDPIRDAIDTLLTQDPNLSSWQIWTTIFDKHDSDASYGTVCAYIHSRRPST